MNPSENIGQRQHDVVVWGATGFTGKLVVEYLQDRYPEGSGLGWAVAGRNEDKLRQLLQQTCGAADARPVILADSHQPETLQALASSCKVVLTTVGPYALYGDELVEACVQNGTHYCDLAGEVQWMRRMIDRHQDAARQSGARIVHSCGFDSIPSDIGVQFLQEHCVRQFGSPCEKIELLVKAMKGGGSGGTIASALNALDEARADREIARILVDPYSLNPEQLRSGPDERDQNGIRYSELARTWTAPFVMAIVNMRIVRRSNALMDFPYGREFLYNESIPTGGGPAGWLKSAGIAGSLGAMMAASSFSLSRKTLVEKMMPKPGEGPDKNERENGFYNLQLIGALDDGTSVRARVKGDRDPGYGSTSKMLSESAVCLARDEIEVGGGFWTPASAMGSLLRRRLVENAGLTFEIEQP